MKVIVAAGCRVLLPTPYPLPLYEGGGGAAEHTKTVCYFRLMRVIVRPDAVSSSRPLTPSPLYEGGGGAA